MPIISHSHEPAVNSSTFPNNLMDYVLQEDSLFNTIVSSDTKPLHLYTSGNSNKIS